MAVTSPRDDKFHEECGVFGVWNVPDAAAVTALGLHALQHRGQESTGIVSFDGHHFHSHRGLGLVGDNFGDARVIASLPGTSAIGHNRYATTGGTILRNVQPLYADFEFGGFAVAHNGNLTNSHVLRRTLVRASPVSGIDRTLGLVFGLVRGAALCILAYIAAGMVVQVERWPDPVLNAESVWPVYRGAKWVVDQLPADFRPRLYSPPAGRETTASALLQATPQGRAVGR